MKRPQRHVDSLAVPYSVPKRRTVTKASIDDLCPIKQFFEVFVDSDDTIFHPGLNLSSIESGNNKYYYIQLLSPRDNSDKYAVWTH